MNGNWFPWGVGVGANTAAESVAAWRHVHDIFASVGATNATWVWCPYADPFGRFGHLRSIYPGSRYVDWTCMDGYNWGRNTTNPHPWHGFSQIFDITYGRIEKVAPRKPMLLAEISSSPNGGRNMFRKLPAMYPMVRGLVWFDSIDRTVDFSLETSAQALTAFASGIRPPNYRSNVYGALTELPIGPPR
jgi:hypothetical protein